MRRLNQVREVCQGQQVQVVAAGAAGQPGGDRDEAALRGAQGRLDEAVPGQGGDRAVIADRVSQAALAQKSPEVLWWFSPPPCLPSWNRSSMLVRRPNQASRPTMSASSFAAMLLVTMNEQAQVEAFLAELWPASLQRLKSAVESGDAG